MRNKKAGFTLGVLELCALLQAYSLWLAPFTLPSTDGFSRLIQIITGVLSIVLILLPVMGMFFVYREKRWGFLCFAGFPLGCIVYGITAIPVVSYFYSSDSKLSSLFIAFANALVCAAAFWLFVSARPGYTK